MFRFAFVERHLARIEETLWRLAVSHAVPARSRKETDASNYVSEHNVEASGEEKKDSNSINKNKDRKYVYCQQNERTVL
jgi:hypothetical protein